MLDEDDMKRLAWPPPPAILSNCSGVSSLSFLFLSLSFIVLVDLMFPAALW